jgi:type I restriction enzyme, S subunit
MNGNPVPEGWDLARIRDKFTFTTKPRDLRLNNYKKVAVLPMEAIPTGHLYVREYQEKPPSQISSGTYFEEGDLLLSKITPCFENGKQAIAAETPNGFGIATTEVIPIKPIPCVSQTPFLAYYLLDSEVRAALAGKMEGATGRQRLSKSLLEEWEIAFPPLPEQQAIAGVLSKLEGVVEVQDRIVATLKELKAATLAKLFHEGLRSEPLKDTEIGGIPESWEVVSLQNVVELQRGFDLPGRLRKEGNVPVVSSSGVTGTHESAKVKGPGVVTGRYGTLGQVFYIEVDFWPLNTTLFCKDFRGNDPLFVSFLLQTLQMGDHNDKSAVPGVNRNSLHMILVGKPRLDEQVEIGNSLATLEKQIRVAEEGRATTSRLFSSILHLLMTGELRLRCQQAGEERGAS